MSARRLTPYLSLALLVLALAGIPMKSASPALDPPQDETLVAGRNVNMVSGTTLPGGDPWLQRQNEPSIAVSTRNPLHLLAGANDYRTVDMASTEGSLPGRLQGAMAGDAWVGIYKSFDGGESWTTGLIHGFPQDNSAVGMASPLKAFSTASDPIVRAGTNGLFYYSGMAFNRAQEKGGGGGSIFLTRFIDNNNVEGGDPIKYLDTKIIDQGTSGQFIDMPRIGVDIPRGSGTVTIDAQTIPRSNVYAAYTVFLGNTDVNLRSRIMFRRSTDCGATWGSAIKISESQHIIQGATIAIDPNSGAIYVAFRRFLHPSQTNAIVIMKSTDFGQTFSQPTVIANINPFDQPATDAGGDNVSDPLGTSFRTNSYPTMTVDNTGIVYVAWTERGRGPGGAARIVMATSQGGSSWTAPAIVENPQEPNHMGHQFMPYLTFAAGKLTMVWYDQRNSAGAKNTNYWDNWISDWMPVRQTIDIRVAQATPGLFPSFEPSVQVSRYLWALFEDGTMGQVQYNPPNYPLFKGGTVPFTGDYIEVTPSPMFVLGDDGSWGFNTASASTSVFHVAWADNRDVRPPDNNDWTKYNPPNSDQGSYGSGNCNVPENVGMRNQNIYTSRVTQDIEIGSRFNDKPLGTMGYLPSESGGGLIPRAFVIYVRNNLYEIKSYRLKITGEPVNGNASFLEFENLDQLDVMIAPFSNIARTVFATSTDPDATVKIGLYEIDISGNEILKSTVILNQDSTNPVPTGDNLYNEEIYNPNIVNPSNPNIVNPNIVNWTAVNPNIVNPNIVNPNIVNPNIVNPNIVNPNIVNPNIVNPNIVNPNIVNPNIVNPNIVNPNIVNPNIVNPNIVNYAVTDVNWAATNTGNTTATYTLKLYSKEQLPVGVYAQLLVYRESYTPASYNGSTTIDPCELKIEPHHEVLLNVTNPNIVNPNIVNPNIVNPNIVNSAIENAIFTIGPGEKVLVTVRVVDTDKDVPKSPGPFDLRAFAESLGTIIIGHAVNTEEAKLGKMTPPFAATKLIIGTASLPDGYEDQPYTAALEAYGGTSPYSWALNDGELPLGLHLNPSTGEISGTPQVGSAESYNFSVEVRDSSSPQQVDTQRYSIAIYSGTGPSSLTITTSSLPNGFKGYWYGATLEATGGVWPRTWSLFSGTLPPGLILDSSGVITGTPTTDGPYNFEVCVTDSSSPTPQSVTKALIINISASTPGSNVTISGTVYDSGGNPLDGVVLRGLPNTPITGANGTPGYYEDEVPEFWSGTVIPFKAGHAFSPSSKTYSSVGSNQSGQDYNIGYVSLTISGTVLLGGVGLPGVVMTGLPGSPTPSTDAAGYYSGTVTYGLSWTVTPTLAGYTFTPASQVYTGITSNQSTDYTAASLVGPASKLVFTQSPNGGVGGAIWTLQPKVEVQDAGGNKITSDDSTVVTLVIQNNPGGGSLLGPFSMTVTDGEAIFTDLYINKGGWGYTLEAISVPSLTEGTSETFNIEGFSEKASMSTGRVYHTATFLYTDKILIAGGENSSGSLQSAELYDPETDTFASLDDMNDLRGKHTATPLLNGIILIAGGGNLTSTAELFDPVAISFTPTGNMTYTRQDHGATLLQDGRVLITGGSPHWGETAEIYDPITGTFSLTGSMQEERNWHTSTWLPNGKVLIAGGKTSGDSYSATAELYDPSTGMFASVGSLAGGARAYHSATLLNNGTVLITGGSSLGLYDALDTAEIYDPGTNAFAAVGPMNSAHMRHQAILLRDGTVLIVGEGEAEIYDPSTLEFRLTGPSYTASGPANAATTTKDGLVFVSGGYGEGAESSTEMWNPLNPFPTHVISGYVNYSLVGVPGVLLAGLPGFPLTNLGGYYEGLVLDGYTGTVTPTKPGYTFNPLSIPYTNVTSDLSGQNYETTAVPTYTISGRVHLGSGGVMDVEMFGLPGNPLTDSAGNYTATVIAGWSGTVTPTLAGYTFTPASMTYASVTSNQTGQDYEAFSAPTFPEINIRQNTTDIADGGSFDFGSGAVGSNIYALFTIENIGAADLTITTPITITGTDSDQFFVEAQPTSPVGSSGSTTFEIRFSPTSGGAKSASIAIGNNDSDENPYDITLSGTGTAVYAALFTKIMSGAVVTDGGASNGCAWGDYDNDGDLDLFVANWNQNNFLYTNNGGGSFAKVTSGEVVTDGGFSRGCTWGDYDNDGDLDLFVSNYNQNNFLYTNNGGGSFTKVTSGEVVTDGGSSTGCAWGDYDNDGDLDLFVANWNQNNFLYTNNGDGTFAKVTSGELVTDGGNSNGCAWGDYDDDGDLDLFVSNGLNQNNFLYMNNGDGTFTKVTSGEVVTDGGESHDCAWGDYDNDGDLDLFVSNSAQNNFLYTNNGGGSFTKVTSGEVVTDGGSSIGCAWGDYDNDGDLDLFVSNTGDQNNFLYANNGNSNNWINIKCNGIASNSSAIGAKVKVLATINGSPVWQLREIFSGTHSQDSLNAEFGLGDATTIDEIRIEWPSGIVQTLTDIAANQYLTVTENEVYEFMAKWGSTGTGNGEFDYPVGIAVDSADYVYVVDNENARIQKFNSNGTFVTKWGSYGTGDGQFSNPWGIAADSAGHIYVTESGNNRVQKFNSNGTFVTKWGSYGTGDGQFDYPLGIAVDSAGDVYVVDNENARIQKFTSAGTFVTKWGSTGTGDGQLSNPHFIAVDSTGYVYITDTGNDRIQKFRKK